MEYKKHNQFLKSLSSYKINKWINNKNQKLTTLPSSLGKTGINERLTEVVIPYIFSSQKNLSYYL